MTRAIRMETHGGPEVLQLREVDIGSPDAGQVLVGQTACGVNFLDVYHRTGAYPLPLPGGCGSEAAGTVEAVGAGVTAFSIGDRVAYQGGEPGSYAQKRILPAARLVKVPDGVTDEQAAAVLLKGMTVEYLLNRCVDLKSGDFALMYAAAGGVGLLAGQWAKHRGIRLIGVAAGAAKCAKALANGYEVVIDRNSEDVLARIREITGGKGVPVVFDSIGKATFTTSIDCLAPRGILVSFGATSGPPPPVEASLLQKKGSLYFTRPTLATYAVSPEEYAASSGEVFAMVANFALRPEIGQRYPLADAAKAHEDLEAGRTSGSTILIP
ncbi:quinone oxidoreductase family protein [Microvirga antarctica]|uniref:quinone oxidoreductase family protein n=1 Tax=Microvirga antarctica TaxID=2819233 RepID=UPI001B3007B8|nr:quinone oxidoreductase [Microvirga antarctica]